MEQDSQDLWPSQSHLIYRNQGNTEHSNHPHSRQKTNVYYGNKPHYSKDSHLCPRSHHSDSDRRSTSTNSSNEFKNKKGINLMNEDSNILTKDLLNLIEEKRHGLMITEAEQYIVIDEVKHPQEESYFTSDIQAKRHGKIFERNCRLYFRDILRLKPDVRLVISTKKQKNYEGYVSQIKSGNLDAYRPGVLAEVDGHFIGDPSIEWKIPARSIKVIKENKPCPKEARIILEAKAGLFHDKTILNGIWKQKVLTKTNKKKQILEQREHEEKLRLMKEQALRLAKACNMLIRGLDNSKENNSLPLSVIYMFNGFEPAAVEPYLEVFAAHLKNNLENDCVKIEFVYCESEALDEKLSDLYVTEYDRLNTEISEKDKAICEKDKTISENEMTISALLQLIPKEKLDKLDEATRTMLRNLGLTDI